MECWIFHKLFKHFKKACFATARIGRMDTKVSSIIELFFQQVSHQHPESNQLIKAGVFEVHKSLNESCNPFYDLMLVLHSLVLG